MNRIIADVIEACHIAEEVGYHASVCRIEYGALLTARGGGVVGGDVWYAGISGICEPGKKVVVHGHVSWRAVDGDQSGPRILWGSDIVR